MISHSIRLALPDGGVSHIRHWRRSGAGPAGSTACLLIHGFGESSCSWSDYAAALTSYDDIYAVDLRGHGDSSRDPIAQYTLPSFVGDLDHVVDMLRLGDFVLVGHSLGGDIALSLASRYPGRVRAVVLVDFAPELNPVGLQKVCADLGANLRVFESHAQFVDAATRARPLLSADIAARFAQDMLDEVAGVGFVMKVDPVFGEFAPADLQSPARSAAAWDKLRALACPLLLVRGTMSSVLARDAAERSVRAARDGTLREVRAGHAVMQDNPKAFLDATVPFHDALRAARGSGQVPAPQG
ncbi:MULTISPECIES: alpha/beta fold hydrolase [unclassified Burkholderia]|uniref:alpha/beta fold hydrolase n=1 Tax=unclassified Burkholderia TaxID=2613784 RepID=UPI000F57DCD6|nr:MULTISPECIES: alpha/beta hydrolase [unclassified Burkholderia]RQR70566.1 alpha/beta hydrolase [Burkholderia sp. Bp9012]RQR77843.1 alpha/beta hydrolase [Burkholderia sp. Bp9011]RQR87839.1 alpha/beta hydrolase [Burkholderia sp. Bp9010]RQZ43779.1 alpha/beta hydrolase [Burkholderia sp. Bp9099]